MQIRIKQGKVVRITRHESM